MEVSKVALLSIMLAVLFSTCAAQFGWGGIGDLGFGFGGKPFGRPSFGGFGGKPGLGGLGLGGKPGKPFGLGGYGGLGGGLYDLYRYQSPTDLRVAYYN